MKRVLLCIVQTLVACGMYAAPVAAQQATNPWVDPPEVDGQAAGFMMFSSTHSLRCRGGATSANPEQSIQVEVGIIVDGVVIAQNWAWGYQPTTIATGSVPYADYPRQIICYMNAPFA